ncbi:MAG: LysR substrate-binding domain-containing protein [Moraxellaceae bacterium]|nr:LysR substrate-binding domain-containing protein [Moraxellaceae bacterium]MDZ4386392.1 LysR substrate-binding domain-containing protein [Moraxellaceae bacterium]
MTLTELRYLVVLSQELHFGRAAERCHVSQPTLSVAIKKLEDSLNMVIFERHRHGVLVTPTGEALIKQAQTVLSEADRLERMAHHAKDEFAEPLRLGAIFTIGPFVFPELIRHIKRKNSRLKLYLEENYTHVLAERLNHGALDAILVAHPFEPPETRVTPIFNEDFKLLIPSGHEWENRAMVNSSLLSDSPVLMLGEGHCFRDQVLETCALGQQSPNAMPGSSLMTLRHMVASGLGLTLIPASAEQQMIDDDVLAKALKPAPSRQVLLASRYRFPRQRALEELTRCLMDLQLPGTEPVAG